MLNILAAFVCLVACLHGTYTGLSYWFKDDKSEAYPRFCLSLINLVLSVLNISVAF